MLVAVSSREAFARLQLRIINVLICLATFQLTFSYANNFLSGLNYP